MTLTRSQQIALVVLRTVIGWHFAYEGFYKLVLPGWSRAGQIVPAWSASGYLQTATGPLASVFHGTAAHASMVHAIDVAMPLALLGVGLSLMLGVLTQAGCAGAILLLGLFYASQPPLSGMPMAGAEGTYLLVNKNLVELVAVAAVMAFRTGQIAGLDVLWAGRRAARKNLVRGVALTD